MYLSTSQRSALRRPCSKETYSAGEVYHLNMAHCQLTLCPDSCALDMLKP